MRTHHAMISRVMVKAVNRVVMMPIPSVTAKPRTGPVRGFAVTLGVGIITTLFTAFTMTRLIMSVWVRQVRPQTVPI